MADVKMVSLDPRSIRRMLSGEPPTHRTVAIRHASIHEQQGLMGDDSDDPSAAVWLRNGDEGGLEAFATGDPFSMLGWLGERAEGKTVALVAPPSWERSVRATGDRVETGIIQTWLRPVPTKMPRAKVGVRRLTHYDRAAFKEIAPDWALRSWGTFSTMIARGAAFGVPNANGFLSISWIYEFDGYHDKIGVFTSSHYRRLGLGQSTARALVDHIVHDRNKHPLWVTNPDNSASITLANSLGFSVPVDETLLRWTPSKA